MNVVWTRAALTDLDAALAYTAETFPSNLPAFEARLLAVTQRIALWPESGRLVEDRPDVRVIPLIRYPYRLFYTVDGNQVFILHLHHAARDEPESP